LIYDDGGFGVTVESADECVAHHEVTLRSSDDVCVETTTSVPWPGTTASLGVQSSCLPPIFVHVRAVNSAGLAGPSFVVPVPPRLATTRPPSVMTSVSSTKLMSLATTAVERRSHASTSKAHLSSACPDGSPWCKWTHQLCSASMHDGRLSIVNRTETSIAVRLLTDLDVPLQSAFIRVRWTTHVVVWVIQSKEASG